MRNLLTHRQRKIVLATTFLTVMTTSLAGCALFDRFSLVTIPMVLDREGYTVDVTTNPIEVTDEVCNETLECVEAYSTDEADYYRFASRDAAKDFESTLDDGFVVHYIVMDFANKPDASTLHQQWAMEHLASIWQDYEGTFPDR